MDSLNSFDSLEDKRGAGDARRLAEEQRVEATEDSRVSAELKQRLSDDLQEHRLGGTGGGPCCTIDDVVSSAMAVLGDGFLPAGGGLGAMGGMTIGGIMHSFSVGGAGCSNMTDQLMAPKAPRVPSTRGANKHGRALVAPLAAVGGTCGLGGNAAGSGASGALGRRTLSGRGVSGGRNGASMAGKEAGGGKGRGAGSSNGGRGRGGGEGECGKGRGPNARRAFVSRVRGVRVSG